MRKDANPRVLGRPRRLVLAAHHVHPMKKHQICLHLPSGMTGVVAYGVDYIYANDLADLKQQLAALHIQRCWLYCWDTLLSEGTPCSSGKQVTELSDNDWQWLIEKVAYENHRLMPLDKTL